MTHDFSTAPTSQEFDRRSHDDDLSRVRDYLNDTLETWIFRVLPAARIEGGTLRAGGVTGEKGSSLSLSLHGPSRGLWQDRATGQRGDVFTLLEVAYGLSFPDALVLARQIANVPMRPTPAHKRQPPDPAAKARQIETILQELGPLQGSVAQAYLRRRGITALDHIQDLHSHPRLYHPFLKTHHPAMVALIRDVHGKIIGLHRTYLTPEGTKISEEPQRMMLGAALTGAVRLSSPAPGKTLGIAEGIETALSVSILYGLACWAALSAEGVRRVEIPAQYRKISTYMDNDAAGIEAATDLEGRLTEEGRHADGYLPLDIKHNDYNDVLMKRMK